VLYKAAWEATRPPGRPSTPLHSVLLLPSTVRAGDD
jgi:hypothetical protein